MIATESHERVSVFGIDIDRVTLKTAAARLADWVARGDRDCRYVVTPNLDHVLLYQENAALRQAYAAASLVVADGWPLVTASRMSRTPLPERVAGSDLVPGLFSEIERRESVRSIPRRLATRYTRNAFSLPRLMLQEGLRRNSSSDAGLGILND